MTARYYTLVSCELLGKLREWSRWAETQESRHPLWPPGLRFVRVVEAPTPPGCELVEFDDEGAPEEMEGAMVTPTISIDYGTGGATERTWVSGRHVERWEIRP